jgi:hypothetical protein
MNAEPVPGDKRTITLKPSRKTRSHLFWMLGRVGWGTLLALALLVLVGQVIVSSQGQNDFCQDYIGSLLVLHGLSPYEPLRAWPDYQHCGAPLGYDGHPPFVVVALLPLALLPKVPAFLLWGFGSLAAYLASGVLLLEVLGWRSLRGLALFLVGSILWEPLIEAEGVLNLGQFLLLLLVIAWLLKRKGRAGWSGAALALATLIKLWPGALLLEALLAGRGRVVLGGGLALALGVLLPLLVLGPGIYGTYFGPVQRIALDAVPFEFNLSLVAVVARPWVGYTDPVWSPPLVFPALLNGVSLGGGVLLGEALAGLLLLGVLALTFWCRRRSPGEPVELLSEALLLTILPLVFPASWYAGLIVLLLPGAMLILALRQLPRPPCWWWVLLALSLALLVRPEVTVAWYHWWMPLLQRANLAGWGTLLVNIPTYALLVFCWLQAQLLWWASQPRASEAIAAPEMAPAAAQVLAPAQAQTIETGHA